MAKIRLFVKYIDGWVGVCVCVRGCIFRFKLAVVSPYCNFILRPAFFFFFKWGDLT